ncbi:branched-chain alpha-keto acid dehydrogenase subunit E2 [Halobacteriales archaeon QS_4_69_34]|nr:MAG: branched-chain alpha-keto acid dehydrogenase subunit E2 [Halobacteriales archaeon QS_4_69_34]
MVREFELPDVGEGVAEGEIVSWLVEVGEEVSEDQPVVEVETDKAVVEVPSPVNGTVREIRAEEGEMVPVGTVIITFDVEGEEGEQAGATDAERPAEERTDTATAAGPADGDAAGAAGAAADGSVEDDTEPAPERPGGRVFAAPSARRLARELGVDIGSVRGSGPGGRVSEGDVRAAAEGDRGGGAAGDGEPTGASPSEPGGTGAESAVERVDGESASGAAASTEGTDGVAASGAARPTIESADRERTLATPATRRLAAEANVDLDSVPASERRDGEAFVTPEAVREYADAQRAAQAADARAVTGGAGATEEREERVPYRGIRRTIGQAMERSKYTAPHVTHHDEVDVTELVDTRSELAAVAEKRGISLTYMPFVMKACVAALREFPDLNSSLDEEAEEIVHKHYYNLGVAVGTDAGLMVPVIEGVDRKGMLQLASEMNELIRKAQDRSIDREEMQGGTFTITNFGAIGGEYATPIVNHPETAILGLGAIKEKPRVVESEARSAADGASSAEQSSADSRAARPRDDGDAASKDVVPRKVLTLSLSIDHRVIDGAVAARFTNRVKEYLERPRLLLLE